MDKKHVALHHAHGLEAACDLVSREVRLRGFEFFLPLHLVRQGQHLLEGLFDEIKHAASRRWQLPAAAHQ